MPRHDPAEGTSDSALGFAKAQNAWDNLRDWLFSGPQHAWNQIQAQITLLKRARR